MSVVGLASCPGASLASRSRCPMKPSMEPFPPTVLVAREAGENSNGWNAQWAIARLLLSVVGDSPDTAGDKPPPRATAIIATTRMPRGFAHAVRRLTLRVRVAGSSAFMLKMAQGYLVTTN